MDMITLTGKRFAFLFSKAVMLKNLTQLRVISNGTRLCPKNSYRGNYFAGSHLCQSRFGSYSGVGSSIQFTVTKRSYHSTTQVRAFVKKPKTAHEERQEVLKERMKSDKWWVRWAATAQTDEFNRGMTKYLIVAYIGFILYGGYYFKGKYSKEREINELRTRKYYSEHPDEAVADAKDPANVPNISPLNEYEELRLKELTGKLRTRDEIKLERYHELIKTKEDDFYSNPENVGLVFELNTADFNDVKIPSYNENVDNKCILSARDTTHFYEHKAEDYDKDINFEEKMIFLGRRRKWLMRKAFGDVLEVACGTGRNIKYLDISGINSITYLDPSQKMMEITNKKFREKYPDYKKAGFVVGKAEELVDLASGKPSTLPEDSTLTANQSTELETVHTESKVKYDTIIETFGLCSHHDPVKALQNFAKLLKPGGRIILLEHGRGNWQFINKHLDNRAEKRLDTWGCRWNLDIGELLDDSGLEIVEETQHQFGTLWCIVAKNPGDVKRYEELSIFEKYFKTL